MSWGAYFIAIVVDEFEKSLRLAEGFCLLRKGLFFLNYAVGDILRIVPNADKHHREFIG